MDKLTVRKRILRFGVVSVIGLVGLSITAYKKAPDLIIYPRKWAGKQSPASLNMDFQTFSVLGKGGIKIVGWATQPVVQDSMPVILMIHGKGNSKNYWLETAEWLYAAGVPTVAIDLRAHGESDGRSSTYGLEEKEDLKFVYDWIEKNYPNRTIGLWGHSLGGAVGLLTLEADKRWKFGVITSTFADFSEIVAAYQKRYLFGIELENLVSGAIERASEEAGLDLTKSKPEESAKAVEQPIFYIHGDQDKRIDVSNANRNYNNLASKEKSLHIIKGGDHFNLLEKGGVGLRKEILTFIKKQKR